MTQRILLVEDTEHIVQLVTLCLEARGYDVRAVTDGLSAVEESIGWLPDLILLDILLPKMNGYLVLEALKQDLRTRTIPVMVISAKAQDEDIKHALTLGAADYLVKPFQPKQLLEHVTALIRKEEGPSHE